MEPPTPPSTIDPPGDTKALEPVPPRAPPAVTRPSRWSIAVAAALWFAPIAAGAWAVSLTRSSPPPAALDRGDTSTGDRYGLTLERRRELWADIASHHEDWKKLSKRNFPDHLWSEFDDYAAHNSQYLTALSIREKLPYAIIAMVWDEGVHEHWPVPKSAATVPAVWTPLNPRQK